MNSKSKYAVLLLSSVIVVYAIVGGMFDRVSAQDGAYRQLDLFWEVWAKIRSDYVDEPSMNNALMGAVRGLVEQVDPNGGYLTPKDVAFYKEFNVLKTPGIGVVLGKPPQWGYPVIVSAIPGGPAEQAGLTTGDFIEAIDGITTREMNLVQVYGYLANPPDKPASLTVIRPGNEPKVVPVARQVTKAPPVESRMIDGNIAYVRVRLLSPGKAAEARKSLDELLKKGAASVILDLRASAGGEEKEAVELANLFIESGTVGYIQGQQVEKRVLTADPKAFLTKAPLVVLVNQGTSGPAEIVAGAIGDSNRGQLVGARTFGNGGVQRLIPMEGGNALLLAVARYYTPAGKEIQSDGIRPTVEVAPDEFSDPSALLDDPATSPVVPKPRTTPQTIEERQLNKAIELLRASKVTQRAA